MAAARGRVSVHRSRVDRRLVEFVFAARVREIARRATHVRAHACITVLRAYVRACGRECVRVHSRATQVNHVARCTDSTSSIGAPNAEENEEEEEEDRIDSLVTQTRDRATTSLTSLPRARIPSASTRCCARKIKLPQSLLLQGTASRCGGESKRRILQYSSISSQKDI